MKAFRLALAVAVLASPAVAQNAAPVVAAERAFAARAAEAGVARSFLDFMTDDAIVFAPEPVNAKKFYSAAPPAKTPKEGGALLAWWPNWAGISWSGDLGFTTGPAEVNGKRTVNYFTIWKKQADGSWKWVYDGGASDASQGAPADAPVRELPMGDPEPIPAAQAMSQLQAIERGLSAGAESDLVGAYRGWLAPEARVQGSAGRPATTPESVILEISDRAPAMSFKALGGGASQAGDMAWTYGEAHWTKAGKATRGHYVRVWQRRAGDWRLVFDQLLEMPPPKPEGQ